MFHRIANISIDAVFAVGETLQITVLLNFKSGVANATRVVTFVDIMQKTKPKKIFEFSLFSRIFQFVKPYSGKFYGSIFLAVLMAVFAPIRPYLIQQGYLQRTPRGRIETVAAYRHLGVVPPKAAGELFNE